MNYLLFIFHDETAENSEEKTQEIAFEVSKEMTSNEAKLISGGKHAIIHFSSNLHIEYVEEWVNVIFNDLGSPQYFYYLVLYYVYIIRKSILHFLYQKIKYLTHPHSLTSELSPDLIKVKVSHILNKVYNKTQHHLTNKDLRQNSCHRF